MTNYIQFRKHFVNILKLVVPKLTDVSLIMDEVFQIKLIVRYTSLKPVSGNLENEKFIRPAEIVVSQYIFTIANHYCSIFVINKRKAIDFWWLLVSLLVFYCRPKITSFLNLELMLMQFKLFR